MQQGKVEGGGEAKRWKGEHGGESERTRQGNAVDSRLRMNRCVAAKSGGEGRCQSKTNS
jgi:hypothetical protein